MLHNDCDTCQYGYRGSATCAGMRPNRSCANCKPIADATPEVALPEPPVPRANLRDPAVRELYEAYRREKGIRYSAILSDQERADFDRYAHHHLTTRPSA